MIEIFAVLCGSKVDFLQDFYLNRFTKNIMTDFFLKNFWREKGFLERKLCEKKTFKCLVG